MRRSRRFSIIVRYRLSIRKPSTTSWKRGTATCSHFGQMRPPSYVSALGRHGFKGRLGRTSSVRRLAKPGVSLFQRIHTSKRHHPGTIPAAGAGPIGPTWKANLSLQDYLGEHVV